MRGTVGSSDQNMIKGKKSISKKESKSKSTSSSNAAIGTATATDLEANQSYHSGKSIPLIGQLKAFERLDQEDELLGVPSSSSSSSSSKTPTDVAESKVDTVNHMTTSNPDDEADEESDDDLDKPMPNCLNYFIIDPIYQILKMKIEEFFFFHRHAPSYLVFCIWCCWIFATYFAYIGIVDVFSSPYKWWYPYFKDHIAQMELIEKSYSIFASGIGCSAILFFAMEGTIYPITWVLSQYIWYTVGMLSYTAYLLSILTCYTYFSIKLALNG
jgi:hypothetical protein